MPRILSKQAVWAVLGALLIGILYTAPQLLILRQVEGMGGVFTLRQFVEFTDEVYGYFPRAREVADGHFPPGDLFFDNEAPTLLNPLPPLLFGSLIFLLGDLTRAYLAAQFIFSGLIFLLFVWLGREIFNRSGVGSVALGLVGVLTPIALHLPRAFFGVENFLNIVAKNFFPLVKTRLETLFFARIDDPLLTYLFYLPAIILLFKFWKNPTRRGAAIGAGFFGASLLYVYFHFWVYWIVVLGLVGIVCILLRKRDKTYFGGFKWLAAAFLITALPYGVNYFNFSRLPASVDYILRLGIESGRIFKPEAIPHFIAYFVLAALIYFVYFRRGLLLRAYLFWSFLAGAIVVWNIQFVVGYVPHSDHWPRAVSPLIFVMVGSFLSEAGRTALVGNSKANRFLVIGLTITSLLLISKKMVNIALFYTAPQKTVLSHSLPYNLNSAFKWLDNPVDVPAESRVLSPSFPTSIYLLSFTSAKPFLATANLSLASNTKLEEQYLIANKVFGVEKDVLASKLLRKNEGICVSYCDYFYFNLKDTLFGDVVTLYSNYFRLQVFPDYADDSKYITQSKVKELVSRYETVKVGSDLAADYVFVGPWEKQFSRIDLTASSQLQLVYKNPDVILLKIIKDNR